MNATLSLDQRRCEALLRRESAGGDYVFAVRTTKIYCRPTCSSRTPRRENVTFYDAGAEAERAGFRACKRCRPDLEATPAPLGLEIDAACHWIETAEEAPSLDALAERAGASPFHFQRAFKKRVGVSPKQYALAVRERRLRASLERAPSVTEAALEAGFGSPAAIYEGAALAAAIAPATYRDGGPGERIAHATAATSLGTLLVARTDRGICAIELGDDPTELTATLRERFHAATLVDSDARLGDDVRAAVALVEGRATSAGVPLDIRGTAFQHRVWQALRKIPLGETRSYGQVAEAIGEPSAARAVANACANNALAVAVPCHRVVRSDGGLGGYRWGIERKRDLLARERNKVS